MRRPSPVPAGHRRGLAVISVGTAIGVLLTLRRFGITANGVAWSAAQILLGFIAAWDVATRRILNVVVLPASVLVVLSRAAFASSGLTQSLVAGLIAFLVFLVVALVARGGFGMGDVKLAGLLGLLLGRAALGALLAGCFAGGVAAVFLVASGRAGRRSTFAYGPYLAFGGALWILVGSPLALV